MTTKQILFSTLLLGTITNNIMPIDTDCALSPEESTKIMQFLITGKGRLVTENKGTLSSEELIREKKLKDALGVCLMKRIW